MPDITIYKRVGGVRLNVPPTTITLRQGRQGPAGTPGPNAVTATTATDLVGLLAGDGATVGRVPYPATNGTFQLICTIVLGVPTLSWVYTGGGGRPMGLLLAITQ